MNDRIKLGAILQTLQATDSEVEQVNSNLAKEDSNKVEGEAR